MCRLVWLLCLVSACYEKKPLFCVGNPDDPRCPQPDGATNCTSDEECAPQVCDLAGTQTCVQCTVDKAAACSGETPICGEDHTCRGCTAHIECVDSDTCDFSSGVCAATTDVAYVSAGGTGTTCTKATPCPTLATALLTAKAFIKISAGLVKDNAKTAIDGDTVAIFADPGAQVDRDGDGVILEVSGNANVRIFDLEITGQTGINDDAIALLANGGSPKLDLTRTKVALNQGGGISSSGGTLTVSQSTLSGNQGGGISVNGVGATFDITNNFIFRNGDENTSTFGGANLGIAAAGANRFTHNTVVDNNAATNSGGVICNVGGFSAPNNLIARNKLAGSATVTGAQTVGACQFVTSTVQNDMSGLGFVDPEAPAPFDYHITTGSSVIDQATTPADLTFDIDGEARTFGVAPDQGADELTP